MASLGQLTGSCASTASPEATHLFTAPATGTYVFDTFGSGFNTVLYLLDGDACDGSEIACNDQTGGSQSQLVVDLVAGQQVIAVVDGFGTAGTTVGSYTLNVTEFPACPGLDVGSTVPQTVNGTTTGSGAVLNGTCGFGNAPEVTHAFTAPADGLYSFDTFGSVYNTVLYVLDGATCAGPSLACNDQAAGGSQSQVQVSLNAGQEVIAVVDGSGTASGDYTLNIDELVLDCPDADIGNTSPFTTTGSTVGLPNEVTPSCSGSSTAPDFGMSWTAPADGTYTIDTNGSSFDTILHILDGSANCGGSSLGCNDDGGNGLQSLITLTLTAGQDIVIIVDGFSSNSGAFTLNISG